MLRRNRRRAREINHTVPHRRSGAKECFILRFLIRDGTSPPVRKRAAPSIQPKIPKILKWGQNDTEISKECFQKSRKIVEFPKNEPFDRKFRKFWEESQMEQIFSVGHVAKIWRYLANLGDYRLLE